VNNLRGSHIDVTVDFTQVGIGGQYDLRIPTQISVKHFLLDVVETLKLDQLEESRCAIKVITKGLLLADDDLLMDYPVTNGDILTVL